MHKRRYTGTDRREDVRALRRKKNMLMNEIQTFVNMWDDGQYEDAALLLPTIEKTMGQVRAQAAGMIDWQENGVLVSYAD